MPTKNVSLGQEAYLYFGLDGTGTPSRPSAEPITVDIGAGVGANAVTHWHDYETVINVDFAGSPNTIDVTARKEARLGNVSQKITGTVRTLTFDVRYKTNKSFTYDGTVDDFVYFALKKAESALSEIPILILDQGSGTNGAIAAVGVDGAQGFVGNFTVALGVTQELNGLITVPCTASFSTFGANVIFDGVTNNELVDLTTL